VEGNIPRGVSAGPLARLSVRDVLPMTRGELTAAAGLALAYGATAVASFYLLFAREAGVTFWPAAGLAFAALVIAGPRLWPGVFVGHLVAMMTLGRPPVPADLVVAAGATLAAAAWPARVPGTWCARAWPWCPRAAACSRA
jgi:integral membrane sensor domain MASE1